MDICYTEIPTGHYPFTTAAQKATFQRTDRPTDRATGGPISGLLSRVSQAKS